MRVKISILIWGLLILTAGFVFLLGNLGYIEVNLINLFFKYWPVLLIVAGLSIFFDALFLNREPVRYSDEQAGSLKDVPVQEKSDKKMRRRHYGFPFAGIIIIGVGIAFLVGNFTQYDVLLPIILLTIGLALLLRFLLLQRR